MSDFSQPYSDLISLIRQAAYSSDAIDYFDLHGDDPAMRSAWNWLLKQHHDSLLALVTQVQCNVTEIIAAIGDAPADAPSEPPPALLRSNMLADWVYTALTHYAVNAERATRDASKTVPDATTLPQPGKWQRRGNVFTMKTIIPKD